MAHEWLEAGVAGFRQPHGADADAKIRDPRRAFADVRKRDGEICTRRDLEQDLRQIDTGPPSRDGGPQRHQRRGFLDLVEGAHDQLVLPVDAFETHGWIVGEARGHRAVGLIQLVASRGKDRFWARTVAKRSTHDRPRRLPLGASQEIAPRIGIPPARRHEDIPPA